MTSEEILRKAIEKASKNGYLDVALQEGSWEYDAGSIYFFDVRGLNPRISMARMGVSEILFDHRFAKAFWGQEDRYCSCGYKLEEDDEAETDHSELTGWEYHLQQMVIEENPIQYLETFL